jgi:SAM-dependent methyltransferase
METLLTQEKPEIVALLEEVFDHSTLISLMLSGVRKQDPEGVRKIAVKPVLIRGQKLYQFEYHAARKVTHRNVPADEAKRLLLPLMRDTFRQGRLHTQEADIQVTVSKRGEAHIVRKPATKTAVALSHDRKKNYLLAEDRPNPFLIRLGIMGENGKVLAARYDKFRQINRFLEIVADVVDAFEAGQPLRLVDFGCGKSYLTFALYHYLHDIKEFPLQIVGLDLKQEVVAHCNALAQDLGYADLTFVAGDIQGYQGRDRVDMVVSLHACDTATDDALVKAVQWGAKVILSVPCCQHELFKQIDNPILHPMLKHGIVKERLNALVTDSLRAHLLEIAGYTVQMLEFVEMEHTPKNILLRAVRSEARKDRAKRVQEYLAFRDFWHVRPSMEIALREVFPGMLETEGALANE